MLLVGADDRRERGRADTIIIATINADTGRAALVSVPRDLRVHVPGHGETKINHAYHYGGVRLLRYVVENLTGQRIRRYAKLNFQTFEQAVDALGGVTIVVPDVEGGGRGMNYEDHADRLSIHLRPGRQRLDGKAAMGYVRYRRDGDLQRTARQREFLQALARQHLRPERLPALAGVLAMVLRSAETNLSMGEAMALAAVAGRLSSQDVMTAVLPVRPAPAGGTYYSRLDEAKARQLQAEMDRFLRGSQDGLKARRFGV